MTSTEHSGHAGIWLSSAIALTLMLLPRVKGVIVALHWALDRRDA
ncbi:MAG: DUF983 domain-containing protein [Proteobacteria bacterium]|nr:DUF983 domain-containing protein [Pseudomonadota bacterium]